MSRYDGLIIPRSYSEYINKTDAATLQQALQVPGVLSGAVAAGDNKAVTSNAVYGAFVALKSDLKYIKNIIPVDEFQRELKFPLDATNWFCGTVYGNLNNYGNIAFYIDVKGSTTINKINIIGDDTKITCSIDESTKEFIMTCDSSVSFKSITFIHS